MTANAVTPKLVGRIPELDGLRGLAILMVIVCHYVGAAHHEPLGFWLHHALMVTSIGWSGVDLFFVLSGFLIGGILLDARSSPSYFRTFYLRRVFRILPVYYLWILLYTLLVCGALWLLPGQYAITSKDLLQVPIQLLFLRNILIGAMPPLALRFFGVTWSLAVEEQFYLVAPPIVRLLSVRHLAYALTAVVAVTPVLRFIVFHYGFPQAAFFLMPCRADGLACGMLIAIGWRQSWLQVYLQSHPRVLQRTLFALLLGLGTLLWWLLHPLNVVWITIGLSWMALLWSALLVFLLSQTQSWLAAVMRWPLLRSLGTISYCAYILHEAFNRMAHRVLLHAEPQVYNLQGVGVTLLALVLTLSLASLSWRYFEQPLIRRGHRYSYGKSGSAGLDAANLAVPPLVLDAGGRSLPEVHRS